MTTPRGFSRLETDVELLARLRAVRPNALMLSFETVDAFADRHGFARRIVWDADTAVAS